MNRLASAAGRGWRLGAGGRLPLLLAALGGLLGSASCSGNAQERAVRDAVAAAFPDGPRRCLVLPAEVVGNHVVRPSGAVLWYPSDGPTAPTRHMSVFWAGRDTDPVPDLVSELAGRGVLRLSVVEANTDLGKQWLGPAVYNHMGLVDHPPQYGHDRGRFAVAIYETPLYSRDFEYVGPVSNTYGIGFPSRVYDVPLPPPDQQYAIPLTAPYAVSIVAPACLGETLDEVTSVETKPSAWDGTPITQAKVVYKPNPPAWMRTPAFSEAAIGPNTPSITQPRRATLLFRTDGEKMVYVREDRP